MASTVNCWVQVAAVTGWSDRPSRSSPTGANVSATHPVALLTRMSTGPSCSSAASNSAAGTAGFARSASTARARPPRARISATTASASPARRSRYACGTPGSTGSSTRKNVHITAQPLRASAVAVAPPMP